MSEARDLELFHYGVKGMRWGVTRPVGSDGLAEGKPPGRKKKLKTEAIEKQTAAIKKFNKADEDSVKDFENARVANRSSGMGRFESRKKAIRDTANSANEKKMREADDDLVKAKQEYKQGMKEIKDARRADRAEIRGHMKSNYDFKNKTGKINQLATSGGIAAGILVGGPAGAVFAADRSAGISIARSAGYSRGKSVTIGLLGGTVGGLAASEIAVRERADRGN